MHNMIFSEILEFTYCWIIILLLTQILMVLRAIENTASISPLLVGMWDQLTMFKPKEITKLYLGISWRLYLQCKIYLPFQHKKSIMYFTCFYWILYSLISHSLAFPAVFAHILSILSNFMMVKIYLTLYNALVTPWRPLWSSFKVWRRHSSGTNIRCSKRLDIPFLKKCCRKVWNLYN